jgi:hypothetical protein
LGNIKKKGFSWHFGEVNSAFMKEKEGRMTKMRFFLKAPKSNDPTSNRRRKIYQGRPSQGLG